MPASRKQVLVIFRAQKHQVGSHTQLEHRGGRQGDDGNLRHAQRFARISGHAVTLPIPRPTAVMPCCDRAATVGHPRLSTRHFAARTHSTAPHEPQGLRAGAAAPRLHERVDVIRDVVDQVVPVVPVRIDIEANHTVGTGNTATRHDWQMPRVCGRTLRATGAERTSAPPCHPCRAGTSRSSTRCRSA